QLVSIWTLVLGVHPIGVRDDFTDLGGDSLKAAQLTAQIEKTFNQSLPPAALAQWPTIEQLANVVRRDETRPPWSSLVKLQSGTGPRSVSCFPFAGGFSQELFCIAGLAPLVGQDYSFYGVLARGTDGVSASHASVEEMAAEYITEIKKIQPTGPYFF